MTFVQEFGNGSTSSSPSPHTVATPSIIPVGATLVIACAITGTASVVPTATDAKGNTYTLVATNVVTATTSTGYVLYGNITTQLAAGDLISVTYSPVPTRSAINIVHFTETLLPGPNAFNDNGGNSTATITVGPTGSVVAGSLVFGGACLVNSGRIFTATNGMTTLTKRVSAVASGDRAVLSAYKYAAADGGQTFNGTLDSSGIFGGIVQTFTLNETPPPPPTSGGVIVGGVIKTITSESVIIGGVKKTITGKFVIIGGVKKPVS